ncbi:MAG: RHS repeat-associated core domain-containing protein [Candidatus Aquicultor sp.]|nr:RHS repeat-associated core domain-containing protein [Candidatus Aquicultor sp.]
MATHEYDFRGLRVRKTTVAGIVNYHWDDNGRLVRESDENGNTKALYTYAGQQLVSIEKGGQIYYTHTNHRGDILAITDANQNKVATYSYGPWGELLGQTGSFDQPFRYAGYYFDSETGVYYLKSRYYSPELGRFLTKDTFPGLNADPQSLNLYAYCVGNPIVNVDWDGFFHYKVYKKYWMFYLTDADCRKVGAALKGGAATATFAGALALYFGLVPGTIGFVALAYVLYMLAEKIAWENEGNGVWIRYWRVRPPAGRFALEMGSDWKRGSESRRRGTRGARMG